MNTSLPLPKHFQAAGIAAGIKQRDVLDMALLYSTLPAVMAGTFTTNKIKAASVKLCMDRIEQAETGRAVIINSGNANACTGQQGVLDALAMSAKTAAQLGLDEDQVYVCSTGRIGVPLPMPCIEKGIEQAVPHLSEEHGALAAQAIMTTDTRPKTFTETLMVDGCEIRLTAMAKGAGMIEPNMATMLAFLLTDAAVDRRALRTVLRESVKKSFNRISVDGDMSTNDTVLCFANGAAGNQPLKPGHPQWDAFCALLDRATHTLAMMIIGDGEGAKKVVTIIVRGAGTDEDAERAARAIANSLLVKTSWVLRDANWGRVMDALGYSGAEVQESSVDLFYNERPAVLGGVAADTPAEDLRQVVDSSAFTIAVDLHLGIGAATVYSCDCTEEYVRINV
ncbi:MAG: bifunctional glutamate N-acetyltransferase/amino-acid acetyltransferase ArgJ [Kiritimatiellae bacterium]|nr:bifunctional glutamate N-acetyltransferase/amino-acid acetyltransferase ArgJ [Kiritimatiellia bacterium]